MVQAAGSWSMDACCAVDGNDCYNEGAPNAFCYDQTSSSDWLFGLWPGPPQRFQPTGADTTYQSVDPRDWPWWGSGSGNYRDLSIGYSGPPGGQDGGSIAGCNQGGTYRGTEGEICGGGGNWGATDVEVWYPR